jgi:hypothetical protein
MRHPLVALALVAAPTVASVLAPAAVRAQAVRPPAEDTVAIREWTLVGFDPRTARVFSVTPIASGGGTVRHMTFDRAAGAIWFGTDVGTIGRASVGTSRRPIS